MSTQIKERQSDKNVNKSVANLWVLYLVIMSYYNIKATKNCTVQTSTFFQLMLEIKLVIRNKL